MGTDITPDQLAMYAGKFCTQEEVAQILGVTQQAVSKLLKKPAYREAWERARSETRFALRAAQIESALKGDRTIQIWLGKQELGQSDKTETTNTTNVNVTTRYVAEWGQPAVSGPVDRGQITDGEVIEEDAEWEDE